MEIYNVFMDSFDQTKPYAEVTVLKDGVSALSKIRKAGDVVLVNYGSDAWETTIDVEGNSYFTDTTKFKVRRVEPVQEVSKTVVVEVPSDVTVEEANIAAEEVSDAITFDAVEVVEEPVEEPAKPVTRTRRNTAKK